MSWVCCQRGAREHYAIPRALHRRGALELLLTDAWFSPASPLSRVPSLRGRFHLELGDARVQSFNATTLWAEARQRLFRGHWFAHQQYLNHIFQRDCIEALQSLPSQDKPRTVFAFSYAAREIFGYARSRGWRTVLGQIDPGPQESAIVVEEYRKRGWPTGEMYQPPKGYWDDWREETVLADRIVANSPWSVQCLAREGVPVARMEVIPCAYKREPSAGLVRSHPAVFNDARPLHVLFLGQPIVRKGIHLLLEAAAALAGEPVRFTVAGGDFSALPLIIPSNVRSVGLIPRTATAALYREADVFILPTLSDGFGLTLLEAMAWGLPAVTTGRCGDVVTDGVNGLVLPEPSAQALVQALRSLLADPTLVSKLGAQTNILHRFSLEEIGRRLLTSGE